MHPGDRISRRPLGRHGRSEGRRHGLSRRRPPQDSPADGALLTESISRNYVRPVDGWCWGYARRPIKNPDGSLSNTPSNHSWGLAIDINAPVNCFAVLHTIPATMGALWTSYGFRWGGDYSTTKDWMHSSSSARSPTPSDRRLGTGGAHAGRPARPVR